MKDQILEELASYVRLAWDRQLTESTAGNMSVRIDDEVYITPTNFVKHFFTAEDFVTLNLEGKQIGGKSRASSEYRMHLKIYNKRNDINSVFHAHPRWALLHAATHKKIATRLFPESYVFLGEIEYIPYCIPHGDEFAEGLVPGLEKGRKVFVMQNHGVTTSGGTIQEAFNQLEILETCCFISYMGGNSLQEIPAAEIEKIDKLVEEEMKQAQQQK